MDTDKAVRDESPEKKNNPITGLDVDSVDLASSAKPIDDNDTIAEKTE